MRQETDCHLPCTATSLTLATAKLKDRQPQMSPEKSDDSTEAKTKEILGSIWSSSWDHLGGTLVTVHFRINDICSWVLMQLLA